MSEQQSTYVQMPNGSYVEWPAGVSAAEFKAKTAHLATEEAAPDSRNSIQKSFDENTQTSPNDSLLKTGLKSVVGAIGGPFVHPVDTLAGMGHMIAHPIDQAHQEVDQIYADKAAGGLPYAATKLAGQALGTVALGEAGSAVRGALPKASTALGRAALLGKTPEAAYESALKPSTTLDPAERAAVIKTGLENEIPISKGGLEKLGKHIETLNQAIKDEIASDPRRSISTVGAMRNLDSVRSKFANQVTPQPDMAEINAVQKNFLNNPKVQPQGAGPGPGSLPASEAQAMKTGTYKALGDKAYGEVKGASIEAQKALARGLKEEIAQQFPEIDKLNKDESRLLDLEPVLERAVNRVSNHQAIGLGTPAVTAAAKAVTGEGWIAAVAGTMKAVLDYPNVKSRLAIAVSKSSKIPLSQAMAKVEAYSAAIGASAASSQASNSGDTPNQSASPQP